MLLSSPPSRPTTLTVRKPPPRRPPNRVKRTSRAMSKSLRSPQLSKSRTRTRIARRAKTLRCTCSRLWNVIHGATMTNAGTPPSRRQRRCCRSSSRKCLFQSLWIKTLWTDWPRLSPLCASLNQRARLSRTAPMRAVRFCTRRGSLLRIQPKARKIPNSRQSRTGWEGTLPLSKHAFTNARSTISGMFLAARSAGMPPNNGS